MATPSEPIPLFRSEALVHQRQRLWGNLLLLTPVSTQLLTLYLLGIVAIAVLFLALGDYHRRERVKGVLRPVSGLVRVYAPSRGEVTRLLVQPGESVRVGQVLAQVRTARRLPGGDYLEPLLAREVASQIARLQTEQVAEAARAGLDQRQLLAKRSRLNALIVSLRADASRRTALLDIAQRRRDSLQPLANAGQIPRTLLEAAESERLERTQALASVGSELQLRGAELADLHLEAERLPLDASARVDRLATRLSELRARHAELRAGDTVTVTAPVAGRLSEIYVSVGQQAQPDRPLMALSARDARLEAVLLVPSRAIGFVARGQAVQLRYEAFPPQRFGAFAAAIENVDDSLLLPNEVADPVVVTEPVYRVRARLARERVSAYGQALRLRPGLAFEADVMLERRSLLRWLLDPLFSLRGRL